MENEVIKFGKFQGRTYKWVARNHPWFIFYYCRHDVSLEILEHAKQRYNAEHGTHFSIEKLILIHDVRDKLNKLPLLLYFLKANKILTKFCYNCHDLNIHSIMDAFIWSSTPEGHAFWNNYNNKFYRFKHESEI